MVVVQVIVGGYHVLSKLPALNVGMNQVVFCVMQEERPDLDCTVCTGNDASPKSLAACALDRFGVELIRPLQIGDECNGKASKGKVACTNFIRIGTNGTHSVILCKPVTRHTHQGSTTAIQVQVMFLGEDLEIITASGK